MYNPGSDVVAYRFRGHVVRFEQLRRAMTVYGRIYGLAICVMVAVLTYRAETAHSQNAFGVQGVQIPGQTFGQTWDMPHPLMLGSAPSPTPDDLCAHGSVEQHCYVDAARTERRRFIPDPDLPGHYREIRTGDDKVVERMIRAQELTRQRFLSGE